mmetsp:Transcript_34533/g.41742  ORF Transcript_34533/g.41742 Transcript_34533/m.41742 type:complete len:120 (-) Transcript_34533:728-1087(-)
MGPVTFLVQSSRYPTVMYLEGQNRVALASLQGGCQCLHCENLLDDLEVHNCTDCTNKQQDNHTQDNLVRGSTTGHRGEDTPCSSNAVICVMEVLSRVNDRLTLLVKVLQDAYTKFFSLE